jgi:hypothetical protein
METIMILLVIWTLYFGISNRFLLAFFIRYLFKHGLEKPTEEEIKEIVQDLLKSKSKKKAGD